MTPDDVRGYCLGKPGATEGRPFGPDVLVLKVGGRMFAILADTAVPPTVSLKCEPELAILLRQSYAGVVPGYHLDKRNWNTVTLDEEVPDSQLRAWIQDSYDLVVDKLPRAVREALRAEERS